MGHTTPTHCSRFKMDAQTRYMTILCMMSKRQTGLLQDEMQRLTFHACACIRRPVAQSGQESRIAREGRKAK
jgi:hypothetical protein